MSESNKYIFGEDKRLDQDRTNRNISKCIAGMCGRKKKRKGMLTF
jgi:hypothetical protein